jgi:hypothetical protein
VPPEGHQLKHRPCRPSAAATPLQDVYAYAMICYELFSGRKPFGQIHPIEAARRASLDNARPQWTPSHVNKYAC